MFKEVYASLWHHPVAFWVVGFPFLFWLISRRLRGDDSFVLKASIVFQVAILADAWLNSLLSPIPGATDLATAVAVIFVILGDLRYFVLLERYGHRPEEGRRLGRWLGIPIAVSLVVPAASQLLASRISDEPRVLFLIYEVLFVGLAAMVRAVILPRRRGTMRAPRWLGRLTDFEIVQYALWASADIVILAGFDLGYLLRLVPNFMYYAVFVPFAWWTRPEELVP